MTRKQSELQSDFTKWALEARAQYIRLRLKQDIDIRKVYIQTADEVAKEIITAQEEGRVFALLQAIDVQLRNRADTFRTNLIKVLDDYFHLSAETGIYASKKLTISLLKKANIPTQPMDMVYFRVNEAAVEAIWARSEKGLKLSDRIWEQSNKAQTHISDIVRQGVATGQHPREVAQFLQQYARGGVGTVASQYPNMMERLGNMIPSDMSYEALRLARTEMAAAHGEGVIAAGRVSPSYQGIKWNLSLSHPVVDICDEYAKHDEGLGEGVYKEGNEPAFPAHPNCLCNIAPVHEDPDDFLERLIEWNKNPSADRGLEKWYQNIYKHGAA